MTSPSRELLVGQAERRRNLAALDILRGGAALYVAAYHSVDLLTASGRHFHERGGAARMIVRGNVLGFAGFGFYAVLLFFVLSGFVIHLRQAQRPHERAHTGNRHWVAVYAWRRLMRIYPPLLAALALTAALDAVGYRFMDDLYGRLDHPTAGPLVDAPGTLKNALLVALPVMGGGYFGSNGALWSIGYELWFYLAYVPVLLLLLGRLRMRASVLLVASAVAAAGLAALQAHAPGVIPGHLPQALVTIAVYFPAWVAGLYLADLYARDVRLRRPLLVASGGVASIVLAAAVSDNNQRPEVDAVWCLGISLVMAALVLRPGQTTEPNRAGRWAASSAKWSYSLYLVHVPVILLFYGAVARGAGPTENPLTVAFAFLATIGAGLLMYALVERPSMRLVARPPAVLRRLSTAPHPGQAEGGSVVRR